MVLEVSFISFPCSHTSEQMSEVFNSVGCCASLLREAVGLPSLLVYGVDGVIFFFMSHGLQADVSSWCLAMFDHSEGVGYWMLLCS